MSMRMHWTCAGCNQRKPMAGSKGSNANRRCAECVAKKKTKEAKEAT